MSAEIDALPNGVRQVVQACADTDGDTKALSLLDEAIAQNGNDRDKFLSSPEQAIVFYTMKRLDDMEEAGFDNAKCEAINAAQATALNDFLPNDPVPKAKVK